MQFPPTKLFPVITPTTLYDDFIGLHILLRPIHNDIPNRIPPELVEKINMSENISSVCIQCTGLLQNRVYDFSIMEDLDITTNSLELINPRNEFLHINIPFILNFVEFKYLGSGGIILRYTRLHDFTTFPNLGVKEIIFNNCTNLNCFKLGSIPRAGIITIDNCSLDKLIVIENPHLTRITMDNCDGPRIVNIRGCSMIRQVRLTTDFKKESQISITSNPNLEDVLIPSICCRDKIESRKIVVPELILTDDEMFSTDVLNKLAQTRTLEIMTNKIPMGIERLPLAKINIDLNKLPPEECNLCLYDFVDHLTPKGTLTITIRLPQFSPRKHTGSAVLDEYKEHYNDSFLEDVLSNGLGLHNIRTSRKVIVYLQFRMLFGRGTRISKDKKMQFFEDWMFPKILNSLKYKPVSQDFSIRITFFNPLTCKNEPRHFNEVNIKLNNLIKELPSEY
jgi:hypothetical protein